MLRGAPALAAAAIALAACGSSHPTLAGRCHAHALKLARGLVAPLPAGVAKARLPGIEKAAERACVADPRSSGMGP